MVALMRNGPKKTKPKRKPKKASNGSKGGSHPLLPQVKALVSPFDCTPGSGKHLVDPLPSQSYKLKSRTTVTVGNSMRMVGMISPCFGDSGVPTNYPSALFTSGPAASMDKTVLEDGGEAGSAAVKGTSTVSLLAPIRPYYFESAGGSWRLVSYGVRIRYTGTALNANGTIKYLPNDLSAFVLDSTTTYNSIANYIDGNNHTIMRSVYDKGVYDFNGLGSTEWMREDETYPAVHDEGGEYGETATQDFVSNHWKPVKLGQNASPVKFGTPGMLISYQNNTSSAVQFEVELVENWEVRTPTNTAFQTDSHGNPEISQEVFRTVVSGHMHAAASSAPTVVKSLKAVNAASKSPLGKLVIAAALA